MATVDCIEARLALLPLILGEVVVKLLVRDGPEILIEIDKAGNGNRLMRAVKLGSQPTVTAFAIPVRERNIHPQVHFFECIPVTNETGAHRHRLWNATRDCDRDQIDHLVITGISAMRQ